MSPNHPTRRRLLIAVSLVFACSLPALAQQGPGPQLELDKLQTIVCEADRIVVFEVSNSGETQLYASSGAEDRVELAEALWGLGSPQGSSCKCVGTTVIRFYRTGLELGSIVLLDGNAVRASIWSSEGEVVDHEKWLAWFDARGINAPRAGFQKAPQRQAAYAKRP